MRIAQEPSRFSGWQRRGAANAVCSTYATTGTWTSSSALVWVVVGVAKEVLGARPIPTWKNDQDRRFIQRTKTFQDAAREMKRDSELLDLMVFFGNDFDDPAPIGHQSLNRHGALQTSCVYCAECDIASRRLQALAGWPPLWLDHLRNP